MKRCMNCHKVIWLWQDEYLEPYNQMVMNLPAYRSIHKKCQKESSSVKESK